MTNYSNFFQRNNDLQQITGFTGRMKQDVEPFPPDTSYIIQNKAAVGLDSQKRQETQRGLMELESRLLDYKSRLRRQAQVKVRHWERPQRSGRAGNVLGERRRVERKLNQALDRIKQIRANLSLVGFSIKALLLNKPANNWVTSLVAKVTSRPGENGCSVSLCF